MNKFLYATTLIIIKLDSFLLTQAIVDLAQGKKGRQKLIQEIQTDLK
jgi:hypothetical protein